MKNNNIVTALVAALIASMISIAAYHFVFKEQIRTVKVETASPAFQASYSPSGNAAPDVPFDFSLAAEKVTPAVVHITNTQAPVARNEQYEQIPEFFRDLFGDRMPPQQGPRVGMGSGVIISNDGYIVTNNHVVADAAELDVLLTNNRRYRATVIGTDPTTDLALIKIDEKDLPYLNLANSDDLKVGQWVMAAGNPLGFLNSTVTAGIISALGRNIGILQTEDRSAIESFIQTDAAVNQGNSGGALVNINGDLIGINTAIISHTGAYSGYAFAVPSNIVKKVVGDLKEFGSVQRGFLGVEIIEVNANMAEERNLDVTRGVLVNSLVADGSAKAAGIKEGDIITKVDDKNVYKTSDLLSYIGRKRPGDKVKVTVNRDGKERTFDMTLKARDGSTELASRERNATFDELGADFQEVTAEEAQQLNISGGIKVTRTYPGKFRQQGIRPGFIITHIANLPVKSVDDLAKIVQDAKGGVLIQGIYPDEPSEIKYYGVGL